MREGFAQRLPQRLRLRASCASHPTAASPARATAAARRACSRRRSPASAASRTYPSARPRPANRGTARTSRPRCRSRRRRERHSRRHELAERRQHAPERAAGKAEADQHAGRSIEQRRAGGMRHQRQTERVQQRAGAQHPHGAEAVGDDAAERLADAPQQVLQREREGEDVAAPVIGARQRREKEAERRARPERIIAIRQPKPMTSAACANWRRASIARTRRSWIGWSCRPGSAKDSKSRAA